MLRLLRRKARIDKERQERALALEEKRAAQAVLRQRIDKVVAKPSGKGGGTRRDG